MTTAIEDRTTHTDGHAKARPRRLEKRVDKFEERRAELADAALQTLAELGYARTSLREIAANTSFTHGVLHYYFADKVELITFCVKRYKATCVNRYDQIVSESKSANELKTGFAQELVKTLIDDAPMHRLWYDLRGQSLFEDAFSADVAEIDASLEDMIWRVIDRYAELNESTPLLSSHASYACLDGLFEHALLSHYAHKPQAGADLAAAVELLLPNLVAKTSQTAS